MNPIKILSSLTRIITLTLTLVIVIFVFVAFNYEPVAEVANDGTTIERGGGMSPVVAEELRDDPGFQLFEKWGCKNCHNVNSKKIGPALAGVTERREREWIYRFVQNSGKLIDEGDPTAVKLFNEFNKLPMQSHDLSTDQIDQILAYIEKATQ